jgi:hypothetical protein
MSALDFTAGLPPALPERYAAPPRPEGLAPHEETVRLVRGIVRDLLFASPGFHALPAHERIALAHNLVHVGSYLAECIRDDWYQSQAHLGQRPVVVERRPAPAVAQSAGEDFRAAAASQVGRVTTETLRAVAFPVFVADLIKGTFNAIQDAGQKQMEGYMQLLENVSKTVDEFMRDNVSDDSARDWLAGKYPQHLHLGPDRKLVPAESPPEGDEPDFTADLDLTESADSSAAEDTLVPAARRKLAQTRLKMLSTLVLMGINRIVVTGGKIRATMGFHINTRDTAHAESASQLDTRVATSGSFGYGPWSASASMSVAYVSSTRADSNAELNTQTDLTGEVEIHFQSDYFPIERFADSAGIDRIRSNTPVPSTNVPQSPPIPWGDTSPPRPVEPMGPVRQPSQTPFQTLPTAAAPAVPTPVQQPAPQRAQQQPTPRSPGQQQQQPQQQPPPGQQQQPPGQQPAPPGQQQQPPQHQQPPQQQQHPPPRPQPQQPSQQSAGGGQ